MRVEFRQELFYGVPALRGPLQAEVHEVAPDLFRRDPHRRGQFVREDELGARFQAGVQELAVAEEPLYGALGYPCHNSP